MENSHIGPMDNSEDKINQSETINLVIKKRASIIQKSVV